MDKTEDTLSIPMHTNLKNDDLKYIVKKIKTVINIK